MARARNIKPGFFKNEILGTADPLVGMLFIGLWCLADREGRLEDRPARIKAEIFPYRESLDINGYLTTLENMCFIFRYEVGQKLILIPKFKKHQAPHHTERKSELPPPNQEDSERLRVVTVNSPLDLRGNPPDSLIPDSLIPDSLKTHKPETKQRAVSVSRRSVGFDFETKKFTGIEQSDLTFWKETYPAVDGVAELRKMAAWFVANPANRKKNYLRFINKWLAKAQDTAPRVNVAPRADTAQPEPKSFLKGMVIKHG